MCLCKQQTYRRVDLLPYFQDVYNKRLERLKLMDHATEVSEWSLEGYMDGPITFVAFTHPSGVVFTGWSKFNPNDNKYTEHGGLYRAVQKAVDKYADELAYKKTWGVNILDEDETLMKVIKESVNEFQADGSPE